MTIKCPHCGDVYDYPDCCEEAAEDAEEWLADEQKEFSE